MDDTGQLLAKFASGEPGAADRLLPAVYQELRRIASRQLAGERPGQTLQATALVHEAYLRLVGNRRFEDRRHFFAAAAETMRRILVDRARARKALKRGGAGHRVDVEWEHLPSRYSDVELEGIHELLDHLASVDPDSAEVVRLHVFGGWSIEETAQLLEISRATAYREWAFARAWLRERIKAEQADLDS